MILKPVNILFIIFIILLSALAFIKSEANADYIDTLDHSVLNLKLVSTLISGDGNSKAILKNPANSEVKGFTVGQDVSLIKNKDIKIVRIAPCKIIIEVNGIFEKLECEKGKEEVANELSYISRNSLDGYEIVPPRFLLLKQKYTDRFDNEIIKACTKFDVDPQLVKALIKAESNFDQFAVSPKNAEGLMQLMPGTAKEYGVSNSFNAKENIEGGVKFFKHLLDHFDNDLRLSIAAYNAGKQSVINYGNEIPPYPETRQFVKRVLNFYNELSVN